MIATVGGSRTRTEGLGEVARSFEAVFAEILMRSMRATVKKSGLLQGGRGEELFLELLDQSFARTAARRGSVLGIGDLIQSQLAHGAYSE